VTVPHSCRVVGGETKKTVGEYRRDYNDIVIVIERSMRSKMTGQTDVRRYVILQGPGVA